MTSGTGTTAADRPGPPPEPPGPPPLAWSRRTRGPAGLLMGAEGVPATLTLRDGLRITVRRRRPHRVAADVDPVVRGRGLARLSRRPQPTTARQLQRACVRWAVTLWVFTVLFQRFSLPGQPVALLLPLALLWCVYGLVRGVLEVDRHRFTWWLAIAGISALVVPLQYLTVHDPLISLTSWGLLLSTWLIFVFRLRDRRRSTYLLVLRGVVRACLWLALLIIVMMASQLVIPYQDWLAMIVPKGFLLNGFVITYPISYGSPFYKGNGWIGLEPSVVSFQLGIGLVAALLTRATMPVVLLLGAGLLCTTAGSGLAVALVALAVVLVSPMRWAMARYSLLLLPIVLFLLTPWAEPIISRATEGTGQQSSTGLRAVQPYQVLWPQWIADPASVLFGRGPGSSQVLVERTNIEGLLVATPIKIFFDYGVVAGLALAAFLIFMYLGGPSRAMAVALGLSLWMLQPGTTTIVFVVAVPLVITWWTPRAHRVLESDHVPSPHALVPAASPDVGQRPGGNPAVVGR